MADNNSNFIKSSFGKVKAVIKKDNKAAYDKLLSYGVKLTSICPLMYMNNPLCGKKAVITNSNKLRTYTTARYFTDDEITAIAVKGGF